LEPGKLDGGLQEQFWKLIYIISLAEYAVEKSILGTPCRIYDGRNAYVSVTIRRSSPHICIDHATPYIVTVTHNMLRCLPTILRPVMVYAHVREWPVIPKPDGLAGRIRAYLWRRRLAGVYRYVENLSRHIIPALTIALGHASERKREPVIVKDGVPATVGDVAYCFDVYALYLDLGDGYVVFAGSR